MKRLVFVGVLAALSCPLAAVAHGTNKHAPATADSALAPEQHPWGIAGAAKTVDREVDITMSDTMRFTPDRLSVREGETVRFRIANAGKLMHEMVIGTPGALAEHAALMKRFPNMEHDSPYMAHVPAGTDGTITWTFNRAGEFEFACLIPGHFEAGMKGTITVQ